MDRRCPDCGVTMEEITIRAGGHSLTGDTGKTREGVLGTLGMTENVDIKPVACPECGLTRLYLPTDPE